MSKYPYSKLLKMFPSMEAYIEACLKKLGRKKKDPTTVHVVGQLADIMLEKLIIPKYSDPGSPVVNVIINGQSVKNDLIYLGAAINIMTKDTMKKLKIEGLRSTQQFCNLQIVLLSLLMG